MFVFCGSRGVSMDLQSGYTESGCPDDCPAVGACPDDFPIHPGFAGWVGCGQCRLGCSGFPGWIEVHSYGCGCGADRWLGALAVVSFAKRKLISKAQTAR